MLTPWKTLVNGETKAVRPLHLVRSASRLGALAWLTMGLATVPPRNARALQPPVIAARPHPDRVPLRANTANLRILNTTSDTLRVEIRVGSSSRCDDVRATAVRVLPPGRSWLVAADHPICWRRALGGGAVVPRWTPWQRRTPAQNKRDPLRRLT